MVLWSYFDSSFSKHMVFTVFGDCKVWPHLKLRSNYDQTTTRNYDLLSTKVWPYLNHSCFSPIKNFSRCVRVQAGSSLKIVCSTWNLPVNLSLCAQSRYFFFRSSSSWFCRILHKCSHTSGDWAGKQWGCPSKPTSHPSCATCEGAPGAPCASSFWCLGSRKKHVHQPQA